MLTLTRKEGEAIIITLEDGRQIKIVAKEVCRNQVRIGIVAPRSMTIFREEVLAEGYDIDKHGAAVVEDDDVELVPARRRVMR